MPDDGVDITSTVIYSGFPRPLDADGHLYEKTTTTTESVRGKLLMKGTAAHQLKLALSGSGTAIAVGSVQKYAPGEVDGKVNPDYCKDGDPIRAFSIYSPASVWLILGPTETAVIGSDLVASATTAGECAVRVDDANGLVIGRALEAVTSGSAEHKQILVALNPFTINVA